LGYSFNYRQINQSKLHYKDKTEERYGYKSSDGNAFMWIITTSW
jgi:hypothetical protein